MPQTLLALLGLMSVTLLSLNQHRAAIETRKAMLDDEMEVMASGVALQAMEYIGTKSFDEATKEYEGTANDPMLMSRAGQPDVNLSSTMPQEKRCTLLSAREGVDGYQTCDDLSDFNEMEWEEMPFQVGDETVLFEVMAVVKYIGDDRKALASGTSKNKEVAVVVRQKDDPNVRKILRQPVSITRTYALP